jgi:hypothetical protein
VGSVEPLAAEAVEGLAALPQRDRLLEPRLSALEPVDDLLQLAFRRLEGELLLAQGRTSSTRAPNPPSASSTSTRAPGTTAAAERTTEPPARTIA